MNKLRRVKAIAGFVFVFLFFGLVVALSYKYVTSLVVSVEGRQHAVETLAAVEGLASNLENMEAERTAYTASGREHHLRLYYAAKEKAGYSLDTVKRLSHDDPDQQRRLAPLLPLIAQQQEFDQSVVDAYELQGKNVANKPIPYATKDQQREEIGKLLRAASDSQQQRLRQLDRAVSASAGGARNNVVFGSLVGTIVVVFSLVASRRELAQRRRAEEKVRLLSASLQQATDLVMVANAKGEIEFVNRATEETTGQPAAKLIGKNWEMLKATNGDGTFFKELHETLLTGRSFQAVVDKRKKNGEIVSLYETVTPVVDKAGTITHLVSTGKDITLQKSLELEVDRLANYDALTGLPKRNYFIKQLTQKITQRRKGSRTMAVMVLDIDRFKLLNDVFGFDTGDEIMKTVATWLVEALGPDVLVARIGSDEFGVVVDKFADTAEVMPAVDKVMKGVSRPMPIHGKDYFVTICVGVTLYPKNGVDAATLMRNAEVALTHAKYLGRNNCQCYSKDMSAKASERLNTENSLFTALYNGEYLLNYQPYFALDTRNIEGAEALIKWKRGRKKLISPADFIPALEDTGMIVDVGEWVLRSACHQLKEWDANHSSFPVSVNLSGTQFRHKHIFNMVDGAVRDFRLDPSRLTLEVTESIFIQDLDFAYGVLKKLKDIGISISVDDFGTGYSSLSYLKKLPVDIIKIDKSFVKDVATDPDSTSIVTSIVAMARSLNLKTIAEGVESEEQWKVLRLLRCDMGQGFYFSPLLSPEEMEKYS